MLVVFLINPDLHVTVAPLVIPFPATSGTEAVLSATLQLEASYVSFLFVFELTPVTFFLTASTVSTVKSADPNVVLHITCVPLEIGLAVGLVPSITEPAGAPTLQLEAS